MHRVETRTEFRSRGSCAECDASFTVTPAYDCGGCGKPFCKEHIRFETVGKGGAARALPLCRGCLSWGPFYTLLAIGINAVLLLLLLAGIPLLVRYLTR